MSRGGRIRSDGGHWHSVNAQMGDIARKRGQSAANTDRSVGVARDESIYVRLGLQDCGVRNIEMYLAMTKSQQSKPLAKIRMNETTYNVSQAEELIP